jgi:hypothetical protein
MHMRVLYGERGPSLRTTRRWRVRTWAWVHRRPDPLRQLEVFDARVVDLLAADLLCDGRLLPAMRAMTENWPSPAPDDFPHDWLTHLARPQTIAAAEDMAASAAVNFDGPLARLTRAVAAFSPLSTANPRPLPTDIEAALELVEEATGPSERVERLRAFLVDLAMLGPVCSPDVDALQAQLSLLALAANPRRDDSPAVTLRHGLERAAAKDLGLRALVAAALISWRVRSG